MMKETWFGVVVTGLMLGAPTAFAQMEHGHAQEGHGHVAMTQKQVEGEQTLTGEVVDVFCYLSHGEKGLGSGHAKCAKKCIQGGLPVAIKVGDKLYLASMASHEAANKSLVDYAGAQVTVTGKVMERDGQSLISISHVESAD